MSVPNRKITPVQLFFTLFLSRLFASMTYISGIDRDLKPGETVVATVFSAVFILLSGICVAIFLKNDSGSGLLTRTKNISSPFFVLSDIFYLLFFLAYGALCAARFNLFVNSVVFPNADMSWFVLPVLAGCAVIAYKGMETVSRSSVLFSFIVIFSLVFVFVTASSKFDILNFRGVRSDEIAQTLQAGFFSASRTAELASVPLITPFLNGNPTKTMFKWICAVGVLLVSVSSLTSGILGQFGYEQIFPMYSLTVLAEFGVFERLDAILTAVWVLCFIAKMSYFLFVNSYLLNGLVKIKRKYVPFICAVPVAAGAMAASGSVEALARVIKSEFMTVLFVVGAVLIPLTTVIAETASRKKNATEAKR